MLVDFGLVKLWVWRVSDGTLLQSLDEHTAIAWSAAFSPDGSVLASGSSDGTVRMRAVVEE